MPATNPRITITLTPAVSAVLQRLSVASEASQSSIVGDLLEQAMPVFERIVKVLEAAQRVKQASAEQKQLMAAGVISELETMQSRMERQLGLQLDVLDGNAADLAVMAERIERRSGRGVQAAAGAARTRKSVSRTPASNRGVTTTGKTRKKA